MSVEHSIAGGLHIEPRLTDYQMLPSRDGLLRRRMADGIEGHLPIGLSDEVRSVLVETHRSSDVRPPLYL